MINFSSFFTICFSLFLIPVGFAKSFNLLENNLFDSDIIRGLAGWDTVYVSGEGTGTAKGEQFRFYNRTGNENNLIVHFSGGGICWDYDSASQPITMVDAIAVEAFGNEVVTGCKQELWTELIPVGLGGLFESIGYNPFRGWNVVFIPNTTGDFHIGKNPEKIYLKKNGVNQFEMIEFGHNGYNNTVATLQWVFKNYDHPRKIIVSGDSAGSMGSLYWARAFSYRYPNSKIYQLSDSIYLNKQAFNNIFLKSWNVDIAKEFSVTPDDNIVATAFLSYLKKENRNTNMKHLHINTLYDDVLIGINSTLSGKKKNNKQRKEWSKGMLKTTHELKSSKLNYEFFISNYRPNEEGYNPHTSVLLQTRYYLHHHKGTPVWEWLKLNIVDDESFSVGEEFLEYR